MSEFPAGVHPAEAPEVGSDKGEVTDRPVAATETANEHDDATRRMARYKRLWEKEL